MQIPLIKKKGFRGFGVWSLRFEKGSLENRKKDRKVVGIHFGGNQLKNRNTTDKSSNLPKIKLSPYHNIESSDYSWSHFEMSLSLRSRFFGSGEAIRRLRNPEVGKLKHH